MKKLFKILAIGAFVILSMSKETIAQTEETFKPGINLTYNFDRSIKTRIYLDANNRIRVTPTGGTPDLRLDYMAGTGTRLGLWDEDGVLAPLTNGTNGYFLSLVAGVPTWVATPTPTGEALTKTDDTNVTLTLGGTPGTALLQPTSLTIGWTGTLAAGRLNSNVVQAITNDTNVTGSISAQNLTMGWTGDLAFSRLTQGSARSVLGVAGASIADVASIAAGTDHQVLRRSGTSIGFGQVNLAQSAAVTGVLDEVNGGTGQSTVTTGDILYGSAANTFSKLAGVATGNALISGGVSTAPSWGKVGLTTHVSGTLPVANGGTGATTLTGYLKGNGTSAFTGSATIPNTDISGLGTMSTQNASSVDINGGTIDGTAIGGSTPAGASVTTLGVSGTITSNTAAVARILQGTSSGSSTIFELINTSTSGRNYQFGSIGTGSAIGNAGEFSIYDATAGAKRFAIDATGVLTAGPGIFTSTSAGATTNPLQVVNSANDTNTASELILGSTVNVAANGNGLAKIRATRTALGSNDLSILLSPGASGAPTERFSIIGASGAANFSGTVSGAFNGTLGATTPSTVAATTLTTAGNVAIGSSSANNRLDVTASTNVLAASLNWGGTEQSSGTWIGLGFGRNINREKGAIIFEDTDGFGRGSVHIATNNAPDGNPATLADAKFTVTQAGNIIIPTLSTAGIVTNTSGGQLGTTATVPVANGGTNITSYTAGDLLYATGSTTLTKLPKGTAGQVLTMNAGATAPEWGTAVGDVVGPGSSTDNAIARYDATTGKLLQNSGVTIDDSNSVAINTATATSKLHVYESTASTGATAGVTIENASTGDAVLHYVAGGTTWTSGIDNSSSDTYKIQNSAGLTSGSFELTTAGLINLNGTPQVSNSTALSTGFSVSSNTSAGGHAATFANDGNSTDREGISITAGLDDHTVAGPSTLIDFTDGNGTPVGSISFGSSETAYNTTSDYRLKEDFQDFSGISLAKSIPVYNYRWRGTKKSRSYGVKAHELQKVLPYAVSGKKDAVDEKGEAIMQQADYSKIVPILLKAIQEQQAQIEDLQARVTALEKK